MFLEQLQAWVGGEDAEAKNLDVFLMWQAIFALFRVNGISVEAFHKVGSTETSHATYLTPVYVASILRAPQAFSGILCNFEQLASYCYEVRTADSICNRFKFDAHTAIVQDRDEALIKNQKLSRAIKYKTIRSVFYRYDLSTMFQDVDRLKKQIKTSNLDAKDALDSQLSDPLESV